MRFCLVFALLSMTSCFSLSSKECFDHDWHALGEKDGKAGKPYDPYGWYDDYERACSRYGDISTLKKQYNQGLEVGLSQYCTYDNGVVVGRSGKKYEHKCPQNLESEFVRGYQQGLTEHMGARR